MGAATTLAFALRAAASEWRRWSRSRPPTCGCRRPTRARAGALGRAGGRSRARRRRGIHARLRGPAGRAERFRRHRRCEAIRQRLERHRHPEAVADALRVVPRSTAVRRRLEELEQVAVPTLIVASRDDAGPRAPVRGRPGLCGAHRRRRAGERGARLLPARLARAAAAPAFSSGAIASASSEADRQSRCRCRARVAGSSADLLRALPGGCNRSCRTCVLSAPSYLANLCSGSEST